MMPTNTGVLLSFDARVKLAAASGDDDDSCSEGDNDSSDGADGDGDDGGGDDDGDDGFSIHTPGRGTAVFLQ